MKWKAGEISQEIDHQSLDIELPENWIQVVNGQIAQVNRINVEAQISGHMITIPGDLPPIFIPPTILVQPGEFGNVEP